MTCGVLGCGSLGRGFVASLLRAGFEVAAFDVSEEALAEVAALGAAASPSAGALARGADVLLLALPDTPDILGAAGELAGSLRSGSLVLVMSTVAPETPLSLERLLAPQGVAVLDCPVSGGPGRAESGELAIMAGGAAADFERALPVLGALGTHVVHVGPLGHGEIAKLANNLIGAVIVEGIAEGLALAGSAGADVRRVAEAIAGGSGASWILSEWLPETLFRGDFAKRFSLELMCKDMRIVEELASRHEIAVPALEAAHAAFASAVAAGYGGDDFSRAIALRLAAAGVPAP